MSNPVHQLNSCHEPARPRAAGAARAPSHLDLPSVGRGYCTCSSVFRVRPGTGGPRPLGALAPLAH
eukprot:7360501-Prymnesium_polylepis.1